MHALVDENSRNELVHPLRQAVELKHIACYLIEFLDTRSKRQTAYLDTNACQYIQENVAAARHHLERIEECVAAEVRA